MFIIVQVLMLCIAYLDAIEESAWSYPFNQVQWDDSKKKDLLQTAKDSSALKIGIYSLMAAIGCFICYNKGHLATQIFIAALSFIATLVVYTFLFDIFYAKKLGKSWDYLESNVVGDSFWKVKFGNRGGQLKAVACLLTLIGINFIYFNWLK